MLGGRLADGPSSVGHAIGPGAPGFVQAVDVGELDALAKDLDADLHLLARPGAFVGPGQPFLLTSRPLKAEDQERLRKPFVIGNQRTFEADPRFGFVVLSEIASRALSPTVNDPGTAIDVIATSTRLLCECSTVAAQARPGPRSAMPPSPSRQSPWSTFWRTPSAGSRGTGPS